MPRRCRPAAPSIRAVRTRCRAAPSRRRPRSRSRPTKAHAAGWSPQEAPMPEVLLAAEGLTKHFATQTGWLARERPLVRAVDDVSFTVEAGQTLGIVGESGCGKTTTGKLVLGLERPTGGRLRFEGRDLAGLDRAGRQHYRRNVQAVFQDPYASLNPRPRVRAIIGEPLVVHYPASRAAVP